jgi:WD40 repeat protein
MTLQGHKGAITSVAFNHDSTQVVTCSKDQTWRVWNINVRYQVSEDPKVIREGRCVPFEKGVFYTRMDLSAKGVLAATVGPQERNLHFINTATYVTLLHVMSRHVTILHYINTVTARHLTCLHFINTVTSWHVTSCSYTSL